ncbi:MAG: protein BatD [Paludibacteraceae bacterium]|nr:protein BatD [Paludibacteraceae bacterium]
MIRRKILLFAMVVLSVLAYAEDVSFQANAPKQVILGRPFQLTYTINQRGKDLRAPEFGDFDVLAGPYTSQSSSTSFVNGKRSSSFTLTFTYTLMPRREGEISLAPATITVGHDQYRSNGLKITVLPADEEQPTGGGQQAASSGQQRDGRQQQGSQVGGDNIFMRTVVSKTKVREQECILLSYKIYWAGVDLAQFTNNTKIPEFKGFLKQDLEQGEIQTNLEHYNGRNYQTAVIYQTLLYPQKSGDLQIDPASFEAVLRVQNRAQVRSIFDDFFGSYTNVTRQLTAPGMTIHVESLPSGKPAGFSGGVGHFDISSSITQQDISMNDAVTIKLTVKGTGNMKLLKTPAIDWPEGFEVYDPKVNNNFKNTTSGVSGSKTIEYLAIARAAGDYTIPPIEFSYYDTQENKYKQLQTPEYTLHVSRGNGDTEPSAVVQNYVSKEDIKQIGSDIRYIHTGSLPTERHRLLGDFDGLWYLYFVVPALLSLLLFLIFRKQIKDNADIARVRYKKANKVAQKRLKKAKQAMSGSSAEDFYEEIEKAAFQYLSDRLSIPLATLNKENISDILRKKGASEELVQEVNSVLSTAEAARYAPSMAGGKEDLYQATADLIDKIEKVKL